VGADPRTKINALEADVERLDKARVDLDRRVSELERLIAALGRANAGGKELKRVGT